MSTLLQDEIAETVARLPERKKREVLELARRLVIEPADSGAEPPAPRRVRIAGRLESLQNDRFKLLLDDGSCVPGLWLGNISDLRLLLNQRILIEGRASFQKDGDIAAIEADAARKATAGDFGFAKRPVVRSVKARRELAERRGSFRDIVGKWPGDESDEEIEAALTAMS